MTRRRAWTSLLLALSISLTVGCGRDESTPSTAKTIASEAPLTAEQSEVLAMIRYRNYARALIPISVVLPVNDQDVALRGAVDLRRHRGYATFEATGSASSAGLLQWTLTDVALRADGSRTLAYPPPKDGWTVRPLDPSGSSLDATLAMVLALASDRPENPLLLRQSSAAYLGTRELDGRTLDAFRGPSASDSANQSAPSRITYLVDPDENTVRRVIVAQPGSRGPAVIDFLDGEASRVPLIADLRRAARADPISSPEMDPAARQFRLARDEPLVSFG